MSDEGKVTKSHIQAAMEELAIKYDHLYRKLVAEYRESGEINLEKMAERFGLESYKELVDAIERASRPWRERIRNHVTEMGTSRCYANCSFYRVQEGGEWQIRYRALVDLDRYGIRYALRADAATAKQAINELVGQFPRFGLQRWDDEQPPGRYCHFKHELPKSWGDHSEWAVWRFGLGKSDRDRLQEIFKTPETFGCVAETAKDGITSIELGTSALDNDLLRWSTEDILHILGNPPEGSWTRHLVYEPEGVALRAATSPGILRIEMPITPPHYRGGLRLNGEPINSDCMSVIIYRPDMITRSVDPLLRGGRLSLVIEGRLAHTE